MFSNIDTEKDEFERYSRNEPTPILEPKVFNSITLWDECKTSFPSPHPYAFNTLSMPAMSAECKRDFRSTKKLISPEIRRLAVGFHQGIRVLEELVGTAA